jgi:tRNA(Leu) C34 or U34 (ribose-2'-O)-methylase TrmL
MVSVLGLWEVGWMEADRTERRLWKQTIQAFDVDTWGMSPPQGGTFSSPVQYDDLNAMLASHTGPKVFLIPENTATAHSLTPTSLVSFTHPADAIYVFGSSIESLADHVTELDEVVSIPTPVEAHLFSVAALAAVLYDRLAKAG